MRRFPQDALSHYELARHYRDLGRIYDMEGELDKCIAIEPVPNAVVWKARVALVLRGMDAFRVFDIVFATTKGGPNDATNVLMFQAVKQGLEFFDIGAAAAIANLMIVAIAVMALVFTRLIARADQRVQPG